MKLPAFITRDDLLQAPCLLCGAPMIQQDQLLPEVTWYHIDFICSKCPEPSLSDLYINNCEITYRDNNGKSKGLIYTLDMVFIRFSKFTMNVLYQSNISLIFNRECNDLLGEIPTTDWDYYNLEALDKQIKVALAFS